MFRIFPKFDPRLKADLLRQKRTILLALVCVAISSLLTVGTFKLIEGAVRAIGNAAPIAIDLDLLDSSTDAKRAKTAEHLNVTEADLKAAEAKANAELGQSGLSRDAIRARQDQALRDLSIYCLLVVAVFALKYWFTRGGAYYLAKASTLLANDLRLRVFDKLQHLPIAYFNKRRAGAIQSVLTNDVNVYMNAVMVVRDSIDGPIKLVAGLVAVFFIQWKLALISLFFVPLLAGFVQYNGRKTKHASAAVQADLATMQAFTQESLQGTRVIRAFAAEGRIRAAFEALVARYFVSQMKLAHRVA
ncbi:MAG: ABC transporter transmembrane domain-containing protein, partial [Fimbriimonadaceae bacterium]